MARFYFHVLWVNIFHFHNPNRSSNQKCIFVREDHIAWLAMFPKMIKPGNIVTETLAEFILEDESETGNACRYKSQWRSWRQVMLYVNF